LGWTSGVVREVLEMARPRDLNDIIKRFVFAGRISASKRQQRIVIELKKRLNERRGWGILPKRKSGVEPAISREIIDVPKVLQ
jgi:hypothetical protein